MTEGLAPHKVIFSEAFPPPLVPYVSDAAFKIDTFSGCMSASATQAK